MITGYTVHLDHGEFSRRGQAAQCKRERVSTQFEDQRKVGRVGGAVLGDAVEQFLGNIPNLPGKLAVRIVSRHRTPDLPEVDVPIRIVAVAVQPETLGTGVLLDRHANRLLEIDDALALLAPQLQSTVGISVAALWAACEGILGRLDSKGTDVADRLADIVACTFPRNDAYELVSTWAKDGTDELSDALRKERSNLKKIMLLAEHLSASGDPGYTQVTDQLAVNRVATMMAHPSEYVTRVRMYLQFMFRRLYYQRNLVMHSARFDSVSLSSTARVAPKLVAAGLDQIIHARFDRHGTEPLGLAARASNEIKLLGTPGGKNVTTLLAM